MTETQLAEHVASRLIEGTRAGLVWNAPYPFNESASFLSASGFTGWSRSTPRECPLDAQVNLLRGDRIRPGLFLAGDRRLCIRIWCSLRNTENMGVVALDVLLPDSGPLRDLAQPLFGDYTFDPRDGDFAPVCCTADRILDLGLPHAAPPA